MQRTFKALMLGLPFATVAAATPLLNLPDGFSIEDRPRSDLGAGDPLAGPASALPDTDAISFQYMAPTSGDVHIERELFTMNLDIAVTIDGQTQTAKQDFARETEREDSILAVTNGAVTRVRTTYHKSAEAQAGTVSGSPVQGRSYIVTAVNDGDPVRSPRRRSRMGTPALVVTDSNPDRSGPTQSEIDHVEDDFEWLGEVDEFAAFFDGRSAEIGEEIDVTPEAARRMFGSQNDEGMDVERMTLTLKKTKETDGVTCAVFDAAVAIRGALQPGATLKIDLTGEIIITAGCRPLSVELAGEVVISSSDKMTDGRMRAVEGKGPVKINARNSYR